MAVGRIVEPEAGALRQTWLRTRAIDARKLVEADLTGVTYADWTATELLAAKQRQDLRLIGTGATTRSLIAQATEVAGTPHGRRRP